jgi:polar amino acid transport system permease protein
MNIIGYVPLLVRGAGVTLAAWVVAGSLSLMIGTLLGIMSADFVGSRQLKYVIKLYTFITKGIPAYVQILIAYFVIPAWFGIPVSGFVAATVALAICSSGYVTEIVRSSINVISRGQWDACCVLGYSVPIAIQRIIMPQAFRRVLPALIGELEQLLKSTSLLATIGVTEVARVGMNIISRELNPLPVYGMIAGIYLLFSAMLNLAIIYYQREECYGYR